MVQTAIGRRVVGLREARHWGQADLAREAGVNRSWLSMVEIGDIRMPGGERLQRLASALGVSPDYLLHGDRGRQEVHVEGPAAEISRIGRFLRAHPKVQDALLDLIEPLERRFGLPIERVPDELQDGNHDGTDDAAQHEAGE